jgi:hypothetical protein
LVIGFINRLQVVITITFNTVSDLHHVQSLHYDLLSLFPLVFTIRFLATDLNTGMLRINQSFCSHVNSSQVDLFCFLLCSQSQFAVLFACFCCDCYSLVTKSVTAFSSPHLELSSFETQLNSSQSHIATDGQSISKSWCRDSSGAHDQIFITV